MAKSQSTTEHPIHLKVAVSREDRNLGPYISYLQNNSNLPLSLNSFVVVVLINSGSKEVHDQYLAVRPQGLASDVVIYDATNTRRLVTVAMDTVNGQRVRVDVQATYEDLLKFVEPDLVLQYKSMHDLACQQMRAEFLGDTVEDPSDVDLEPVKASLAPPVAVIEDEDLLDEEEEENAPEEFDAFEDVGGGDGPLVAESPTEAADNQFSVEEEELEEDDSVPFDIDDSDVDEEYHPGPSPVTVQEETATGDVVEEEDDSVPFDIDDSDIEADSSEEAPIFADDDSLESGIYYLDEACTQTCDEDGNPIEVVVEEEVVEEVVEEDQPVEEDVEEEVVEEEIALYQDENTGQLYLDENLTQPCDEEGNPVAIDDEPVEEAVNDNLAGDADQDFLASLQAMDIEGLRVQAKSFGVNHRFANKCNSPETLINKILEKAQG